MQITWLRTGATTLALATALSGISIVPQAAFAQTPPHKTHKSFAKRHPHLTEAAAGVGAYEAAKHTGRNRMRHGRRRNFAQRHPVLTGIAGAGVAHHYIHKKPKPQ